MPIFDTTIKHILLRQWLIMMGVMAAALFVVGHQGLVELLLGYECLPVRACLCNCLQPGKLDLE